MTVWLERGESRYLDLITTCIHGLVEENTKGKKPTKYELFIAGANSDLFTDINPVILESTIKDFAEISQGRYIREFAYALLALDFAEDLFYRKISEIKIDALDKIDKNKFTPFIQSRESRYVPTEDAIKFSKLLFASSDWQKLLQKKVLSYGYFCRYLDVLEGFQLFSKKHLNKNEINVSSLKNLIGPFDSRVRGSGPDFIQETFKTWAFMLDIVDIKTKGMLTTYDLNKKLEYLKEHTGYITDGTKAYLILRNLRKANFVIKKEIPNKIRIVSFMRLVNLELWRREFEKAISTSLRRLRILYFLNRLNNTIVAINFLKDKKLKVIMEHFGSLPTELFDDFLFLESTGIRLETIYNGNKYFSFTNFLLNKILEMKGYRFFEELQSVNPKNIFYKNALSVYPNININKLAVRSLRKFNTKNFEKYLPKGKVIRWIKEN